MGKLENITHYYELIMFELGIPWTDDNERTPERVAKALLEMTQNTNAPISDLEKQLTMFGSPHGSNVEIEVGAIDFTSMCAHHHLPFFGKAIIKYRPGERIFGLSKFPRVVEWFSKKPQTQEHLTVEIGEFLVEKLNPFCLSVELREVTHTCMTCRGVKSHNSHTTTKYVSGDHHGQA